MSNPNGGPNKFKPGESGNPAGRPAEPQELKELKTLNRSKFEALVNEVIYLSVDELQKIPLDKTANGIKVMLASVLIKAINTGDNRRADFFINRLIGKVPERFEGANGEPLSFIGLVKLAGEKDESE
jgi:hypothetical protein